MSTGTNAQRITQNNTELAGIKSTIDALPIYIPINNQNKTVTPTTSQQSIQADSGYTGLGTVTVNAVNNEDKTITINGTYTASSGYNGLGEVTVNVTDPEYADNLLLSQEILGGSTLPYTELEYIQSTGTQYIDAGFVPDGNTEFEIDFITYDELTGAGGEFGTIFGSRVSYNAYGYQLTTFTDGSLTGGHFLYTTSGANRYDAKMTPEVRCTISYKNGVFTKADGTTSNLTKLTFSSVPKNMYIFANHDGNSTTEFGKDKIYSLKFYSSGALIRNFIPVKRNSDNEICMYDKITKTFFTNAGTGSFIAGPVKP